MARIKFTGPHAAQMQVAAARALGTNTPKSAQKEKQERTEVIERVLISEQTQAFRQQQSQEMVQIMLHVSFGTLFYLREFLPLSCFDDRDLRLAHRENSLSYHGFINGKSSFNESNPKAERGFGQGKRGQPLKILIRDRDPKADELLNLLEGGIFDALDKSFLEAVQVTVFADKDAPANVLESYTFSFKYTGGSGIVDKRLAAVSLASTDCIADMKTILTARLGLEMIIRRLITLSTFLPILPNKRNLGIHLFYTEDCPQWYEPIGFTSTADDSICFPLNENWQKESQSCGAIDSGYHSVGLKVTSLKWIGPEPDGSENIAQIPPDIEYKDTVLRTEEIGIATDDTIHGGVTREQSSSQESTQTRRDAVAKQRLRKMMPIVSSTPDRELVPTQQLDCSTPFDPYAETPRRTPEQIQLSQTKTSQIQQYMSLMTDHNRKPGDTTIKLVRCQCSWDGEEPGMIECAFCHTRQHLLCYGFLNSADRRLPDVHACYRCLLEPNETGLLRELNTLVLLRRALQIIAQEGYPNRVAVFSQKLHCNGQTVVQVTDLLTKQGFLKATPGSKSKGFLEKGLPKYSIPQSLETRERMRREIFDPMAKIQHHYIRRSIREPAAGVKKSIPIKNVASSNLKGAYSQSDQLLLGVEDTESRECRSSDDELMTVVDRSQSPKKTMPASEVEHAYNPHPSSQPSITASLPMSVQTSFADNITTMDERQDAYFARGNRKRHSATNSAEERSSDNKPQKKRKMSIVEKHVDVGIASTDEDST